MSAVLSDDADFSAARRQMAEVHLRGRGIRDERVLGAMARLPRELFVPPEIAYRAYADSALQIDCEQTISQPLIVGMMTESLQLSSYHRVLEIGSGSGYQTAILADLAGEVFSVERHAELSRQASRRLAGLGYRNVQLRVADGSLGWPEQAPFDRIIVTAGADRCPPALWEQLAEGGILVGPFGPLDEQALVVMQKVSGQPQLRVLTQCRFVPLIAD
ncbi:MAG: protein-L-isoaspartate(D-aspartate) O-methyltransferase [Pirellulaceae bacterium]